MRTRVGYCGGTKTHPTYRAMGDHTESFQVDFDPAVLSYDALLERFWQAHNPCARPGSRQYMSAVFVHDDAQRRAAEASRDRIAAAHGPLTTPILPVGTFTLAEDYHQKYYLRGSELMPEFARLFGGDEAAFRESPAAARANAYVGGDGAESFATDVERLGLPAAAVAALRRAR